MREDILKQIRENSGLKDESIQEGTNSFDISPAQKLLIPLINEKYNDSLAYQVCEVIPAKGIVNRVFASKRKGNENKFEVVSTDINIQTDTISTGFTREAMQDIASFSSDRKIQTALKGTFSNMSRNAENEQLMLFIDQQAETKPSITLSDPTNLETILFELNQKIAQHVIEMNFNSFDTLSSFCILSPKWAAAILGSLDYMSEGKENSLFVGEVGRTKFFFNPVLSTNSEFTNDYNYDFTSDTAGVPDYAYVGLMSNAAGHSSLIFTPYQYEISEVVDPDTGNITMFLYNRYGIGKTPLDSIAEGKSKLIKFEINV